MNRALAPIRPPAPAVAAAISALDALLTERERQVSAVVALVGRLQEARVAVEAAETAQRKAEGENAFASAIAQFEIARDALGAAARALVPAQESLRDIEDRIKAAWRSVSGATRPAHLAAEAAAEADLRSAAAQVGQAASRLNGIRYALGAPLFPRPTIRDPADADRNAAEAPVIPDSDSLVPYLEDVARLRLEIERLRGR